MYGLPVEFAPRKHSTQNNRLTGPITLIITLLVISNIALYPKSFSQPDHVEPLQLLFLANGPMPSGQWQVEGKSS